MAEAWRPPPVARQSAGVCGDYLKVNLTVLAEHYLTRMYCSEWVAN
ncbi:MAG TPA: hypothetical protein VH110_07145 [Candidatus Acidoferrum sp.]|jgi:hypothetical protein|nr:hypothetical protein [Candidatus Acidoferrum sp.]